MKENYLSKFKWFKERAICSNVPLEMNNDMIAMASNWKKGYRPPKCDKRDDPQVWATSSLTC